MNKVSVLQVRTGLKAQKWKPTPVINKFTKIRYSGGRTTLPVEEMIGTASTHSRN